MSNSIICSNAVTLCDFALGLFDHKNTSQYNYNSAQVQKIYALAYRIYCHPQSSIPEGLTELKDKLRAMSSFLGTVSDLECLWIINKARLIMRRVVKRSIVVKNTTPNHVLVQLQNAYKTGQPTLFEKILIENIVDVNARECCKLLTGCVNLTFVEIFVKAGLDISCVSAYENLSALRLYIFLNCGIKMSNCKGLTSLYSKRCDRAFILFIHGYSTRSLKLEIRRMNFFNLDIVKIVKYQLAELEKHSKEILHKFINRAFEDIKVPFPDVLTTLVVQYHDSFSRRGLRKTSYMQRSLSKSCMNSILEIEKTYFAGPLSKGTSPIGPEDIDRTQRVLQKIQLSQL